MPARAGDHLSVCGVMIALLDRTTDALEAIAAAASRPSKLRLLTSWQWFGTS